MSCVSPQKPPSHTALSDSCFFQTNCLNGRMSPSSQKSPPKEMGYNNRTTSLGTQRLNSGDWVRGPSLPSSGSRARWHWFLAPSSKGNHCSTISWGMRPSRASQGEGERREEDSIRSKNKMPGEILGHRATMPTLLQAPHALKRQGSETSSAAIERCVCVHTHSHSHSYTLSPLSLSYTHIEYRFIVCNWITDPCGVCFKKYEACRSGGKLFFQFFRQIIIAECKLFCWIKISGVRLVWSILIKIIFFTCK